MTTTAISTAAERPTADPMPRECPVAGPMSWADDYCHRYNNFDAMRFWLAALVILSHSYPLMGVADKDEPLMRWTNGQITFGTFAVAMFFALSGFLITQSWVRGSGAVDFFKKRVLRIYPGLIVAVLLGALLMAPAVSGDFAGMIRGVEPGRLLWGCVKLDGYSPPGAFADNPFPNAVNGSLWTIPYEFRCYIMVAGLGLLGFFSRRWLVVGLFTAVYAASLAYTVNDNLPMGPKTIERVFGRPDLLAFLMGAFLSGSVFYLFRREIPRKAWVAMLSAGLLVAAAFVPPALLVVLPLAGTYLFFYLAFESRLGVARWGRHGDFSYGIYLYGFPVQQVIVAVMGAKLGPLTLFPLALVGTAIMAVLSWFLVERPCLALAKGSKRKLRVREATEVASSNVPVAAKESVA